MGKYGIPTVKGFGFKEVSMGRIIFAALVLCASLKIDAGSCCGFGTSSIADGHAVVDHGAFLLLAGGDYGQTASADLRSGRASFGVAYGITDRLALSVRSGYVWLHVSTFRTGLFDTTVIPTDTIKPDTTLRFENQGLEDGSIGLQFVVIPQTALTKQELKVGASVGVPWGIPDKKTIVERREVLLPAKAQSGSGSVALGGFIAYSHQFPHYLLASETSLSGSIRLRDKNGDTRGFDVNATATTIAGPFGDFKGVVSLGYGTTGRTLLSTGVLDTTTGGQRITVSPGIDFTLENRAQFLLAVTVPLWQDENQKKTGNSIGVKLSTTFFIPGFFSHE